MAGKRSSLPWTLRIFLMLAALAPSAYFGWQHRDIPDFGNTHDDAIYFVSARSLADGQGYRIPSLPENPYQTKYPPLYSAFLSLAWRINRAFPENLRVAAFMNWTLLAVFLSAVWALYRGSGISETKACLMTVLIGANPYILLFGCNLYSEILFTILLIATFLCARRSGWKWAAAAGALAGCAYLTRTAGIALLVSMPAWFFLRREVRRAAVFLAAVLPFVAAWNLWTRAHLLRPASLEVAYYIDYLRFQSVNVGWDNIGLVLWKNADAILFSLGSVIIPDLSMSLVVRILTQVMGVAIIRGVVRTMRQGIAADYALFAAVSTAMLLPWHGRPAERFLLPLFPLLLAGFFSEMEFLFGMLRTGFLHKDVSQRSAAYVMSALAGSLLVCALGLQLYISLYYLEKQTYSYRTALRDQRAVYAWINANLPPTARIMANGDPLLYLYTGRTGNRPLNLLRWWYCDDREAVLAVFRDLAPDCRRRGFDYYYSTPDTATSWIGLDYMARIDRMVRENRELIPLFSSGTGTLYKVVR